MKQLAKQGSTDRISRRRFLTAVGVGAAVPTILTPAARAHDGERPPAAVQKRGEGFLAYIAQDADARKLFAHLEARGFIEVPSESMLARDYAGGPKDDGVWIPATVAYTTMKHPNGTVAAVSAVRNSPDQDLRTRPPEAVLVTSTSAKPVSVLNYSQGGVTER